MSPEAFPKGFHVRKTIAFALVLTLLLPIAAFWGWLVLSPKPPLLDGVPFSPLVLDRDGNLLRLGLSEDEKLRLIEQGASEFWEVERFDADRLVLVSRPFGETRVGLRVFRGGDRLLAALGTDGGAMCALELWQEDATGGFVPANPPDDPQLSDFLASGQRLAADVSPAFMFCLEDDGLDVRPLFWGPAGLVDVPVAKSVRYIWKSGAFEKTVSGKPE